MHRNGEWVALVTVALFSVYISMNCALMIVIERKILKNTFFQLLPSGDGFLIRRTLVKRNGN
jgi:hypothetical protein